MLDPRRGTCDGIEHAKESSGYYTVAQVRISVSFADRSVPVRLHTLPSAFGRYNSHTYDTAG